MPQTAAAVRSMFELAGAGLLPEPGLQQTRRNGPAVSLLHRSGVGAVQAVKDQQIALGIVHRGKGSNAMEMVVRRKRLHLVVLHLVPCDIPARTVGSHAL